MGTLTGTFMSLACIINCGRPGHCTDTSSGTADVLRNKPREEITGVQQAFHFMEIDGPLSIDLVPSPG